MKLKFIYIDLYSIFILYCFIFPTAADSVVLANATKCGPYFSYVDTQLPTDAAKCKPAGRCMTFSLTPPEEDLDAVKESFTVYWNGLNSSVVSFGREIRRERLVPMPFQTDPAAFVSLLSLPKSFIDLLIIAQQAGNVGDYINVRGKKHFCGPHSFFPINREEEGVAGTHSSPFHSPNKSSGTFICNGTTKLVSFASFTEHWRNEDEFDPERIIVVRGWFNMDPDECINLRNQLGLGSLGILYIAYDGKGRAYNLNSEFRVQGDYSGYSGYGDENVHFCVRKGSSFRYEVPLGHTFQSCTDGLQKISASLIIRDTQSDRRPYTITITE